MISEIGIKSSRRIELVDITDRVNSEISKSKIKDGICHLFAKHATAALTINENEPGLKSDFEQLLERTFSGDYQHNRIDDNASAHLASMMIKPDLALPIRNGRLELGAWQSVFVVELDGPRGGRKISVTLLQQ